MAFKALFIAHAPDANYLEHNSIIETKKYKLFSYVVKNQEEAVEVAKEMHEKEKIHAIMLCPGFSHTDVAELFAALGGEVSVNVARGDGPSSQIAMPVIQKEFFGKE